jgi:hypothetical protein
MGRRLGAQGALVRNQIGIDAIIVKTDALVGILQQNREAHVAAYQEAMVVFKQKVLERFDELHAAVVADQMPEREPGFWFMRLPRPEEHTLDYDRAIRMLQLHTEPTIKLSEQAYAQFVDDDWTWKQAFGMNTLSYTGGGR